MQRCVALLVLFSLSAGCIASQRGDARKLDPFPSPALVTGAADPQRLALGIIYKPEGGVLIESRTSADAITRYMINTIEQSKAFQYAPDPRRSDYTLYMNITEKGEPNVVMGVLCGVTLGIVPWWTTSTFTIRGSLQNNAGTLGEHTVTQQMKLVGQLFLVFVMPFRSLSDTNDRMWNDAFRDMIDWSRTTIDAAAIPQSRPKPAPKPPAPPSKAPAPAGAIKSPGLPRN
jgi:hypothetical protein